MNIRKNPKYDVLDYILFSIAIVGFILCAFFIIIFPWNLLTLVAIIIFIPFSISIILITRWLVIKRDEPSLAKSLLKYLDENNLKDP